jgi:two-component system, cell cycle response regulator DivK
MKKILIVEDIDLNIELLVQLLEDEFELSIAKNGKEGLDLVSFESPDLVLMDISLPVMDGYEATRLIREKNSSLPIIGISAHAMQGDAEKAISAGFSDYLTKPIEEDLLLEKIHKYLGY